MRDLRVRWMLLATLWAWACAILSVSGTAEAESARLILPSGWAESANAAPDAQRRASQWRSALGLQITQVASAPARADDRFTETIAVFETPEPVPEAAFASDAAAIDLLATTVAQVVGAEPPIASELRETDSGERVAWAQWIVDDLSYECVLAPSGSTGTVVIAAVLAREVERQRPKLTRAFAELDGVTGPMPRFSLLGWRLGSIGMWLALALGLHAAMLPFGDRDHDHAEASKRAAVINLILVVIGSFVAHSALEGRALALNHANSSVVEMTVWVAVAGLTVVASQLMVAARLDRGRVQSAPRSGAFSSYSSTSMIRSSISRAATQSDDLPSASGRWHATPSEGRSDASGTDWSTTRGRIVIDDDID